MLQLPECAFNPSHNAANLLRMSLHRLPLIITNSYPQHIRLCSTQTSVFSCHHCIMAASTVSSKDSHPDTVTISLLSNFSSVTVSRNSPCLKSRLSGLTFKAERLFPAFNVADMPSLNTDHFRQLFLRQMLLFSGLLYSFPNRSIIYFHQLSVPLLMIISFTGAQKNILYANSFLAE